MPPHLASSMSSSTNSHNMSMLLHPSVNDSEVEEDIDNKSSDNTNTNMLRATINNTPTDTGNLRPVLSFTNLFNRGHNNNQKVQPNNHNTKRSSSTPVLNNSASTNSMKQQWPCDLSLSNTSLYHTSMQNYNNYDSEDTESNKDAESMGVSSASVASASDIDKSDTTERASNTNAMDIFLSKAGINKQQQNKLQSMRLQQKQQGLLSQNNLGSGIQHVALNDMKSKTQLNNNNANSILSRMVMVGGSGDTNNNNNNNGMPIRIASITDFRQSQGNSGSRSINSSMNNLRQSNRSSISSRGSNKSRGSISRLNSRSSLGSVPENNVSTQNLSNSQWSLDRPDSTSTSSNHQGGSNEVFKNLTRRRSSNMSSASQPNLRQRGSTSIGGSGGMNEQWSDPQDMVKAAGQRGEDIFAKLQELRLQKQIVMEKKEAVLKNSQRWSQPEMLNQMGSSMRGLSDSIKGVGGSATDKNEEWPSSSEETGNTKVPARPVFQRDDKIDEIITLKLKIANQQATIDTLSSKLKTSSQDVIKPEVSQETIKELEAEKQSLTKQVQDCQMREYKLVKELKAQQDDHEREMKQMEEKNLMLRKALEEALNSQQQKSSISSGGSSRSRESRRKTISTRSTSDDESEDEDLAFKTDGQLDDSTKNKSYAWY